MTKVILYLKNGKKIKFRCKSFEAKGIGNTNWSYEIKWSWFNRLHGRQMAFQLSEVVIVKVRKGL